LTSQEQTATRVGEWTLVPPLASVAYEVDYVVGTYRGQFRELRARLEVGEDGRATLEGAAAVTSTDAKDEKLIEHLLADDFFDAANHPELTFAAKDLDLSGSELTSAGELTIKGITKPVQLMGSISNVNPGPGGGDMLGLQLSTSFDRAGYDLNWNIELATGQPALADEVTVRADLFFRRAG
jgi:polyisoprenoid-binding protein YceI